jgi:hypothetical protein
VGTRPRAAVTWLIPLGLITVAYALTIYQGIKYR